MHLVDPAPIAEKYLAKARDQLRQSGITPRIRGFIATDDKPSLAYASKTQQKFTDAGFSYDLCRLPRLELEAAITKANQDPDLHGIFIYFPVFNNQQDSYLRNLVHYTRDIEAGSQYWTQKLYLNDRLALADDNEKKALLPCTPIAIVKLLTELGEYGAIDQADSQPLAGRTVAIFNRSEVIGRPLAMMMSNDGALVYSFDVNGPLKFEQAVAQESSITRRAALAAADLVITGVPGKQFNLITGKEINPRAVCINFSSSPNFAEEVTERARMFVPRVGPMTVAMCMRNTLRLYENFHQP